MRGIGGALRGQKWRGAAAGARNVPRRPAPRARIRGRGRARARGAGARVRRGGKSLCVRAGFLFAVCVPWRGGRRLSE
jgi:hypothetical protein